MIFTVVFAAALTLFDARPSFTTQLMVRAGFKPYCVGFKPLMLTGSDLSAHYQQVLESVTFTSTRSRSRCHRLP